MTIETEPNDTIETAQNTSWLGPGGYLWDWLWGEVGGSDYVDAYRVNYTPLTTSLRLDDLGITFANFEPVYMSQGGVSGERHFIQIEPAGGLLSWYEQAGGLSGDSLWVEVAYGSAAYRDDYWELSSWADDVSSQIAAEKQEHLFDWDMYDALSRDEVALNSVRLDIRKLRELEDVDANYAAIEASLRIIADTYNNSATDFDEDITAIAAAAADLVNIWTEAKILLHIDGDLIELESLLDIPKPVYHLEEGTEFGYLFVAGGIETEYYGYDDTGVIYPLAYDINLSVWSYSHGTPSAASDLLAGTQTADSINGLAGDDTIYGMGGNDRLYGGDGDDILEGGAGRDYLSGGLGLDRAVYVNAASAVVVNLTNPSENTGEAAGDTYNSIESVWGSEFNDRLTGNHAANGLVGQGGNDILRGLVGNDRLFGGDGNDTLDGGPGADYMSGGSGTDRVTYQNAIGSVVVDLLNVASNTGEAAGDTYNSIESLTGSGFNDTLSGTSGVNSISGGDGNDRIYGRGGNDSLFGNDGNDTLIGGAGADRMYGGTGDDIYYVDNAADVVVELAGEGNDLVASNVSYALAAGAEIETLRTTANAGTAAINLTGNAFNQTIFGNAGANTIRGGGGTDILKGLSGKDVYYVDSADDIVVEGIGQGTDMVAANVSYALAPDSYVEVLRTTANSGISPINLTGNKLAQEIIGNAGSNVLHDGGQGAADTLRGLGGNDTYRVFNAGDIIIEGAGEGDYDVVMAAVDYVLNAGARIERLATNGTAGTSGIDLTGNEFGQEVVGNSGANMLDGKGGNDIMKGLAGNDVLTGGAGLDAFVFNTALHASTNVDRITDFSVTDDVIHLENAIFWSLATTGTLAASLFKDIGLGTRDADDRILYNSKTGFLYYDADGASSGYSPVKFAALDNKALLTAADFMVV